MELIHLSAVKSALVAPVADPEIHSLFRGIDLLALVEIIEGNRLNERPPIQLDNFLDSCTLHLTLDKEREIPEDSRIPCVGFENPAFRYLFKKFWDVKLKKKSGPSDRAAISE